MEEKTIRAIPPVPLALMMGAISGVVTFIAAIIVAVFWLPYFTFSSADLPIGMNWIFGIGALIIIIMPIAGFIIGFIQGLITAVVYNFLAPRIGGIKVRFE
jgi:hypothetical protein